MRLLIENRCKNSKCWEYERKTHREWVNDLYRNFHFTQSKRALQVKTEFLPKKRFITENFYSNVFNRGVYRIFSNVSSLWREVEKCKPGVYIRGNTVFTKFKNKYYIQGFYIKKIHL
jgi:hypothetical protein